MQRMRKKYEPWIRDNLRKYHPDLEAPLLEAIDACDSIFDGIRPIREALDPIVKAASSSRRALCDNATDLLGLLAIDYYEAREAVEKMANDSNSSVRFNSLTCLRKEMPLQFTLRLICQGLRDKSAKVRWKAGSEALTMRIREALPDLEAAVKVEMDAKAKTELEFDLKLLRDGYILELKSDGRYEVTSFSNGGIASKSVQREDIEKRGIEAILTELAKFP